MIVRVREALKKKVYGVNGLCTATCTACTATVAVL